MSEGAAETGDLTPAQIVSMEFEGYLYSDGLDPAWIAGWHAAINHATSVLKRAATPPASPTQAGA